MRKLWWVEPVAAIGAVISVVFAIMFCYAGGEVNQNYLDYAIFMSKNDEKCARLFCEATDDSKLTYHEFSKIRAAWDEKCKAENQSKYANDMANARSSMMRAR